jgi:hypothetical protein
LTELKALPMTRDELQCLLGLSKPAMRRYIDHLRDPENKRIFIAAWRGSTKGRFAPVHALGDKPDAPQPTALTRHERNALQWRRIKADRDRHDRVKASARVYGAINRMRGKPQGIFAALGI